MSTVPPALPKLTGSQFCPYTEPRSGKQHFWSWVSKFFPDSSHPACRQFLKTFEAIMNDACDTRDRGRLCPSDVPSPKSRISFAPYSGEEVAAWWNEALDTIPTELLATMIPTPPPKPARPVVEDEEEPEPEPEPVTPEPEIDLEFEPTPPKRRRKSFDNFM